MARLQALAASSDKQADHLAITEEMRTLFQPPPPGPAASSAVLESADQVQPPELLTDVPPELLSIILSELETCDLASLAATCRSLWCDAPTPPAPTPPALPVGLVESELRRRAEARGLDVASFLPEGALSWVSFLLKRAFLDAFRGQAPLAVGSSHSLVVDAKGRLLTVGREADTGQYGTVPEGMMETEDESLVYPPTPVPSMQGRRFVSVATSPYGHCLALSAEGEVYSWGHGNKGRLGHADGQTRGVPCRVETLSHIELIAVGPSLTSAAVDEKGSLYTWGSAFAQARGPSGQQIGPSGLGYELDAGAVCQLTPKRVDALSQERVVGVALGPNLTLAVTDAGAVFSFGYGTVRGPYPQLGHGSHTCEVLPRRIEALAETGQRFVAVAAGGGHSLALTEEGHVYGWGHSYGNGHGQDQPTPQRVAALASERVVRVWAQAGFSGAVTDKGALFTWGAGSYGQLGHGLVAHQEIPKRVEALSRVKVTAVACYQHMLVADEDGGVWGFGERSALGLGTTGSSPKFGIVQPTPVPDLFVRTLKFK